MPLSNERFRPVSIQFYLEGDHGTPGVEAKTTISRSKSLANDIDGEAGHVGSKLLSPFEAGLIKRLRHFQRVCEILTSSQPDNSETSFTYRAKVSPIDDMILVVAEGFEMRVDALTKQLIIN